MKLPWRKRETLPIHAQVHTLTSWDGNQVVGVIQGITDGEVTYLTDLYIAPGYRGHGRGKELMLLFLREVAHTTVITLTQDAGGFYCKFGFTERTAMVRGPSAILP